MVMSSLFAYLKIGTNMEQQKKQRGGRRPGSGRPANDRNIMVGVRVSQEAADILNAQKNKSEFIDTLIKEKGNERDNI